MSIGIVAFRSDGNYISPQLSDHSAGHNHALIEPEVQFKLRKNRGALTSRIAALRTAKNGPDTIGGGGG